jgi:hypothetical protein
LTCRSFNQADPEIQAEENPERGRLPSSEKRSRRIPEILEALTKAAKDGDMTAARLLLERTVPALRPADTPVKVNEEGSLIEAGENILRAVGGGEITPDQAGKLLQGLGAQDRVLETDELQKRITVLEEKVNGNQTAS